MTPTKFSTLLEKQSKAENDMRRAFNRWNKTRAAVIRAEKILDKGFGKRADAAGNSDWRDFAVPAKERDAECT